jgi:hypothetical protein
MTTEPITIQVNPEIARAYLGADDDELRKLDLLVNLKLREAMESPSSLQELMRDIGRKARERGLTPEILESILNDD